jgi:hypothetical protein
MVSETEVAATASTLQFFKILGVICGASFSTLVYTGVARKQGAGKDQLFREEQREELLLGLRATFWFWSGLSFLGNTGVGMAIGRSLTPLRLPACILTILALRKVGTSKVEQNDDQDHLSNNSAGAVSDVDADTVGKGTCPPAVKYESK